MKDLQVKYTDPLDLIPYENNPRINDYAVKKVMESIKEYGFTNPIIVDADMVIIAGHTRREASIQRGKRRKGGAGGERNYHKSINNSYKRERATVRGSSI